MEKRCWLYADAEASLLTARRTACRFEGAIVVRKRCTRSIEKNASGFRQLDPARSAAEELHVQLIFDVFDPLAERRLLQAKALCGSRDMAFLRDSNELAKMAQLHDIFLSI
jgi:hypothetical protein